MLTRNNPVLMRSYRKAWAERNRDAVLAKHAAYRASDIGLEYARKTGKANTSRLSDSYVRSRLGLSAAQAPKELIEAKRLHLRLVRLLKELK